MVGLLAAALSKRATSATPQIVVFAGIQDRRRHESLSESGNRVATPGGDPISPVILGVTMYALYEVSIQLVRVTGR